MQPTLWWEWTKTNYAKLASHGLSRRIVEQVAAENPKFRRNRKGHAASHQMIGPDHGGRIWTVCIRRIGDEHWRSDAERWRVITGWPSSTAEKNWYRKG